MLGPSLTTDALIRSKLASKSKKSTRQSSRKRPSRGQSSRPSTRPRSQPVSTRLLLVPLVALCGPCLTGLAALLDIRAFVALATPPLYAWCALSLVCAGMVVVLRTVKRHDTPVPTYVWLTLALGIAGGFATLPTAWRVVTKHEERLVTPVRESNIDWRDRRIENVNLSGMNLQGADLDGTVLKHVELANADLAEAELRGAQMMDVDLSKADLCGADLRNANLSGAIGLDSVSNWAYTYYNAQTRLPRKAAFIEIPGPVPDTGRGLLYMCTAGETRSIP